MKLFKTDNIEITYECGNTFGIELPSLQLVKRGSTGIFRVHGATVKCLGNGSPQVSGSPCTKSTTPCCLNWLLKRMTTSSLKYCTILIMFCTNFSQTKLIIPRLPQIDLLFNWWWCLNVASYKKYWLFMKYFTSGPDFLQHIVKVGLKAVTISLQVLTSPMSINWIVGLRVC